MGKVSLYDGSVRVILDYQDASGAYPASPNFAQFRYGWIRDGAFSAYAMLLAGHPESCRRFLLWVHRTISTHEGRVLKVERSAQAGEPFALQDMLPARYTLSGQDADDDWPNFQTDCYGTWLWLLTVYIEQTGDSTLLGEVMGSVEITLKYLALVWREPCYDPWEEHGEERHPSSLGCVLGGIAAINRLLDRPALRLFGDEVRSLILANMRQDGALPKFFGSEDVDSSCLWLCQPFGVFAHDDPIMVKTVAAIEADLLLDGGLKRYLSDTYYGGGQWISLSCWLAWHYIRSGRADEAEPLLRWAEAQANTEGHLPEQVLEHVSHPEWIAKWDAKWGANTAAPLLWSHAMYIVAMKALAE